MKELQAKAKVTQTMTRDGLVVENQADGTVENVSCREAEQDYSTDAEGKAEKILERAEDIKDGHKNKKKAKKAAETAATAESEDGLHRSAARLELTEDERADPELQPYIHKAEAKADTSDAYRAKIPPFSGFLVSLSCFTTETSAFCLSLLKVTSANTTSLF